MAEGLGIFGMQWFSEILLPFLLVFILLFAILQKSKLFGEDKTQTNSLISLVMALILVGVPLARGVITDIVPIVGVVAVVLLIFMIILGMVGYTNEGNLNKGLQITVAIIMGLTVIIGLLWSLGLIPKITDYFKSPNVSPIWQSLIFIIIIIVLFVVMMKTTKEEKK
jgi:cytochrome bd-type quinol oxidase subunit 2